MFRGQHFLLVPHPISHARNQLPVPWVGLALLAHTKHRCRDTHGCTWRPKRAELMRHKLLHGGGRFHVAYPITLHSGSLKLHIYYPSQATGPMAMRHTLALCLP